MTTHGHANAGDAPGHADAMTAGDHHDTADHGEDSGHDDHAHADDDALGPIDVAAWGAGLAGILLGVAMAAAFYLATQPV